MTDDTNTPDGPEIGANASKKDLKAAADAMLKEARAAEKAAVREAAAAGIEAEAGDVEDAELSAGEMIMALEAEKEGMRDQLLRTLAEMENVRKRADRQVADAKVYAVEKFAGDLLSVSDNMSRALEALPEAEREGLSEAGKNLLGGIEMTQKELHTVLARHGVTSVDAAPGATFDPNVHQAVSQIPSDHPSGTIAAMFQGGWKIGDRVLRAAMVAVSLGQSN